MKEPMPVLKAMEVVMSVAVSLYSSRKNRGMSAAIDGVLGGSVADALATVDEYIDAGVRSVDPAQADDIRARRALLMDVIDADDADVQHGKDVKNGLYGPEYKGEMF